MNIQVKKEKVAFVVVRYGKDINGGAEYHCQMLAERLTSDYDVDVLTTCVRNADTGLNEYREGIEYWNEVLIRRFKTDPIHPEKEKAYANAAKPARKWRRLLYRLRLLAPLSYLCPIWTYKQKDEIQAMNASVFYSSALQQYIKEHRDEYKAFIAMSLDYSTFYYTAIYAGDKTIAIPTMHYVGISFRSLLTTAISKMAYVGFNTGEEEILGERIFGRALGKHGIISVGIETSEAADWNTTKKKYKLPDDYLLYVGRITRVKLYRLLSYFMDYKRRYKESSLRLVLVGGVTIDKIEHSDIIYTGYVSDEEKMSILRHAKIVVNPSNGESLSLILLEAMSEGKPMLVNGRCKVLKEHCCKSNFASLYYLTSRDFTRKLYQLDHSVELRKSMGKKGMYYVKKNYDWPLIMERLRNAIEIF